MPILLYLVTFRVAGLSLHFAPAFECREDVSIGAKAKQIESLLRSSCNYRGFWQYQGHRTTV